MTEMKRFEMMVAVLAVVMAAPLGFATPITGSIEFEGQSVVNSGITALVSHSDLAGTVGSQPAVKAGSQIGDYAGVAAGMAPTWTLFTFNPLAGSVTPLWNMSYGGKTYSFNATSMTVNSSATQVDISGTGIAHITGFEDTYGTWTAKADLSQNLIFTFGAATPASGDPVPDGGTTVLLLGAALSGVAIFRRKLA